MKLDWIERWSATAYDLDWNPVSVTVGRLNTDQGERFAILLDERVLAKFAPGVDRQLITVGGEFVSHREDRYQ